MSKPKGCKQKNASVRKRGNGNKLVLSKKEKEAITYLSSMGCPWHELASELGIAENTLKACEEAKELKRNGYNRGCRSLRSKQFEIAKAGNVSMLTWLGKQYLGQSDKSENKNENVEIKIVRSKKAVKEE